MHDGAVTSNSAGQNLTFVLAFAFLWNSQVYDAKQKKEWSMRAPLFLFSVFKKKRPGVADSNGALFLLKRITTIARRQALHLLNPV
jgi:hypothetical protein